MKALLIGDVVGRPGRIAVERFVVPLREERGIDVTWSQLLPLTAEVDIVPAIDLLDPETFL